MNPRKVVTTSRDLAKGQEAAHEILRATNETRKGVIEAWELDLANHFETTVRFARRTNEELDRPDIDILNAGILTDVWTATEDGYETS